MRKIDVIWNLSSFCPWRCRLCAVAAKPAFQKRISRGRELSFEEKLKVLNKVSRLPIGEIDFSGGDPLFFLEDTFVVWEATKLFPREMIEISVTGASISEDKVMILKRVGLIELTVDTLSFTQNPLREEEYLNSSLKAIKLCKRIGVKVRAVTPLHRYTLNLNALKELYTLLNDLKVDEWELLRFYPVGRAQKLSRFCPDEKSTSRLWMLWNIGEVRQR